MNYGYAGGNNPWVYNWINNNPYTIPSGFSGYGYGTPGYWCGNFWNPNWGAGTYPTWSPYAYGASLPSPMSDEELRDFVYESIDDDTVVPINADIAVHVNNGVVTLEGTVPNKRIKHAIGDDAWWIPQVVDVHNQIEVAPRRSRAPRPEEGSAPSGSRRAASASR